MGCVITFCTLAVAAMVETRDKMQLKDNYAVGETLKSSDRGDVDKSVVCIEILQNFPYECTCCRWHR
jgi:hypothetical protein